MPTLMTTESRARIAAALTHSDGEGVTCVRIGEALVTTCRDLDAALAPVLGRRGVGALYKRSLHLIAPAHPWLPAVEEDLPGTMDLAPLQQVIARQTAAAAAAAGADLLQTFRELLVGLVGASLTERLLRSVGPPFTSGPTGQDIAQ